MVDDEREHELTHSPRRSRWWPWDDGYASACTARLVEGLAAAGCTTVALQVAADNAVAIACYRNLGFRFRGIALQTRCERLTS